jgi:hypothetical protein
MSLEYSLVIATEAKYNMLEERLCQVPGYKRTEAGLTSSSSTIEIHKPGRLEYEVIKEEFGFTPSVSISFLIDKESDPIERRTRLAMGCLALLGSDVDNAVLLFNGEYTVMIFQQGSLDLNSDGEFWTKEVINVISTPYNLKPLRNI